MGMLDLVGRLRASGYKVGLFSNVSMRHKPDFNGMEHYFDIVAISGEMDRPKPYESAYLDFAKQIGESPEAIVFVDDNPYNAEGAAAAGLHGIQFIDQIQLQRDLLALGIRFED